MQRTAFAEELHKSVDGKGLRHASLVPYAHDWVMDGTLLLNGAKFNAALGIQAATLPTKLRAARGLPDADHTCDACGPGVLKSLSHITQVCPRTHGARTKGHNRVLEELAKMLKKKRFNTILEPHFKTSAGLRKPDLLIHGPDLPTAIIDITITTDMYDDPNTPHFNKCNRHRLWSTTPIHRTSHLLPRMYRTRKRR